MVLSEQAMRRWKVAGGLATAVVGFISVFVVEYQRPASPYGSISDTRRRTFENDKHVFSDIQEWFWGRIDSSLGIPRQKPAEDQHVRHKEQ